MIFDAHAHIYPDKLAARAVAALNGFYDFVCDGDGTYDVLVPSDGSSLDTSAWSNSMR